MISSISSRRVLQLCRIGDCNTAAGAQCHRSAFAVPEPFLSSVQRSSKGRLTDLRVFSTAKPCHLQESNSSASNPQDPNGQPSSSMVAAAASPSPQPALLLPPSVAQLFPCGEFSLEMQVRDYELDQFSVVNNAVYSSYFQHARHEAFSALGHDVDGYGRRGTPLALSNLNITFRAPLRSRDVFRVTVTVAKVTGARVVMHQRILRRVSQPPPQPPLTANGTQPLTTAPQQTPPVRTEGCQSQRDEQHQQATAGSNVGGSEAEGSHGAPREEELVAEAEVVVVFLDAAYRPSRMPRDVARIFQTLLGWKR